MDFKAKNVPRVVHTWALPKPERFLIRVVLYVIQLGFLGLDAMTSGVMPLALGVAGQGDQALWSGERFVQIPGWSRWEVEVMILQTGYVHCMIITSLIYIVCWWELRSRWVPNCVKWVENSKWVHHEVNWLDFPYHPFRSVTKHRAIFFEVVRRGGVVFWAASDSWKMSQCNVLSQVLRSLRWLLGHLSLHYVSTNHFEGISAEGYPSNHWSFWFTCSGLQLAD